MPRYDALVNERAEQSVLGTLLIANSAYDRITDIIDSSDFALPVHARIFEAIVAIIERGGQATTIAIQSAFVNDDQLAAQGGLQYLVSLVASFVTGEEVVQHATVIADLARRRKLIEFSHELIGEAANVTVDRSAESIIDAAEVGLIDIADHGAKGGGPVTIASVGSETINNIEEAYKRGGGMVGVTTGLADLDRMIGGLMAPDLVILAGRPSMGKTALAAGIVRAAAKSGVPSAIFELEMSADQLVKRYLADMTGIDTDRQVRGDVTNEEFGKLIDAQAELSRLPIFIDDQAGIGVAQIKQRARRLRRRHGLGLIVVDHLQLMQQGGKVENRRLEIGAITSGLKALAKEFGIPVVLLSQLTRALESREDKRPMLQDLRESGDIEQDADVVMFCYREEYYLERSEPNQRATESVTDYNNRHDAWGSLMQQARGIAEIIVGKRRNGPTGKVRALFDAERTSFRNLAQSGATIHD